MIGVGHTPMSRWSDLFVRPVPRSKDTNPQHWKFLIFYYNPDDARLFVPRRWTGNFGMLNFARPAAWVVGVAVLILILVMISLKG